MPKRTTRDPSEERPLAVSAAPRPAPQWLTLKEASEFLGVHFTTLRTWADRGELRVFRTPGGHRRYPAVAVQELLRQSGVA